MQLIRKEEIQKFMENQVEMGYLGKEDSLDAAKSLQSIEIEKGRWDKFVKVWNPYSPDVATVLCTLCAGFVTELYVHIYSYKGNIAMIRFMFHLFNFIVLGITYYLLNNNMLETGLLVYFGWNSFVSLSVREAARKRNLLLLFETLIYEGKRTEKEN